MAGDPEPATTQPPDPGRRAGAPPPEPRSPRGHRVLVYAKVLSLLFFVAYSIAFIVGNDRSISIDFVFATARVSLIWTILLLLAVGLAGGVLLVQLYRHRRAQHAREH